MKDKGVCVPSVGAVSLLTVFCVLCLVIFAVLSVSTAQSQRALSQSCAESVEEYYEAQSRAEELLARLRSGEIPPEVEREGTLYGFSCPISERQSLQVQVQLEGTEYHIVRWQAVSTLEWQGEKNLNVWGGD